MFLFAVIQKPKQGEILQYDPRRKGQIINYKIQLIPMGCIRR